MKKFPFLSKALILLTAGAAFGQVTQLINALQQSESYAAYNPVFADEEITPGPDTPKKKLKFPIDTTKKPGDGKSHSLDLNDPSNIKKKTVYDTATGKFITTRSLGDSTDLGSQESYDLDEYLEKSNDDYLKDYFKSRAKASNFTSNSNADLKFKVNNTALEDVFGEEFVDIKPQGSAELIFMGEINRVENPAWSVRTQRNGQFKFDQKIRLNVLGKIGDKINLNLNYDTEANF